jgi:ATP-binding cassette subfamily B protein
MNPHKSREEQRLRTLLDNGGERSDFELYRQLLMEARPYWGHIVIIFAISLLATPLALMTPLPLKIAVDSVIGSDPLPGFIDAMLPSFVNRTDTSLLLFAALLLVGIALMRQLQELAGHLLRAYAGERLVLGFRARIFRHVQRLSLSYHDTKGTADSTYRIQYDAPSLPLVAVDGVIPFVVATLTFISMLYVIFRINWQLSLVALAISPILFLLTRSYRPRLRRQSREVKKLESSALSVVQEVLTAMRVVKAFGQEDREAARFVRHSSEGLRARLRLVVVEGAFGLVVGVTTAAGTAIALFIGVRLVQSGALTLGELLLVTSYLAQLYEPLKTVSKKAATIQNALASAERAFALLDEAPDVQERRHARPIVRAQGALEFQHVSFAYGAEHNLALDDVSFRAATGTRLGVAGATGAGKTTLVSLLTRFYDPTSGTILLDNLDLREYRLSDLRSQFAIVLQEPVLFSTSIEENIAYAKPNASMEEIIAAAQAANAHDFILRLPQGYGTRVGERGMRLSGGERQRISLARAFLKDAPILILDEPTSSVDIKTETAIMESMERLMAGRTTIMIAHRLSTLEHCDGILRIEHGRIVDDARGTPAARSEPYAIAGMFNGRQSGA